MVQSIFWSVFLRTGQLAVESSTTLLCGLIVAGVMRRMLGADGTRRLFGGSGWKGLFRAWGVGTLLPVCSLGVIPIAREMRRAGVPSGTILAFVLAAPHINPLSLLYGLTLSEPLVIVCFAAGSLIIALGAGAAWERFFATDQDTVPIDDEPMPAPGPKRLAAVVVSAGTEAIGCTIAYVFLSLFFTGLLAGLLPHGCLGHTMRHDDLTSPLLMTALALPAYAGPLQGIMRLGLIFEHGNSVGAAFALFELGIGVNIGLFAWLITLFGWRRVLSWAGLITAATLVFAYAIEYPLYFAHEEASHTHAFDEWTSPFPFGAGGDWQQVHDKLIQKIDVLEPLALAGLALLVIAGLVVRFDREGAIEAWLTRSSEPAQAGRATILNWHVPGPILGITALLGLFVFSVAALYLYYPAPKEAFDQIVPVRVNAISAVKLGHKEEAIRQIQQWDLLTRKLQVGVFIRTGRIDPELSQLTEDLRERLEDLRDALLADNVNEANEHLPKVEEAYRRCRNAYEPSPGWNGRSLTATK